MNIGTEHTNVREEAFLLPKSEQPPALLPWKAEVVLVTAMIFLFPHSKGTKSSSPPGPNLQPYFKDPLLLEVFLHLFLMSGIFKIILLVYNLRQ